MTDDKKDDMPKRTMSKEEYLRTHLLELDPAKRRWYISSMEKWTSEDYDLYTQTMLWMMGEVTDEQLKRFRASLKKEDG